MAACNSEGLAGLNFDSWPIKSDWTFLVTRKKRLLWLLLAALLLPTLAYANGASETFTRTSLLLILMITLADICGFIFEHLGMPEILGEIYAGIMLGNLALVGINFNLSALLRSSEFMEYSSELALVLLLFLVGLESDMRGLLRSGATPWRWPWAGWHCLSSWVSVPAPPLGSPAAWKAGLSAPCSQPRPWASLPRYSVRMAC